MPTFAGETVKERYQRELNQWNERLEREAQKLRMFDVTLFIDGARVTLPVEAAYQGEATTKVLDMFDVLPKGFTMICKEAKA